MFAKLKQFVATPNIAIDLGTANTRIYAAGLGGIAEEPSFIRHIQHNRKTNGADKYITYLNSRFVSMPLRGGVIVDIRNAVSLLKPLVKRTRRGLRQPVSLACAPTDTTEKERKLLAEAIMRAGASHVAIIPEVWAAAIGAGIDVTRPSSQVLIDIGEGVTDMAVIRNGCLIFASAVRVACSDLQKAVRNAVMARYKVCLYPAEMERLTHEIASFSPAPPAACRSINAEGLDMVKRREVSIEVQHAEIHSALEPVLAKMLKMIESGLRKLPDRVAREIVEPGICLTGGGACIKGIDRLIGAKTGLDVRIAADPLHSVINGASRFLQYWQGKDLWWENIDWPDFGGQPKSLLPGGPRFVHC
ncbi:MAG: rod shape-determining protein [Thermodesulfobacteriota bacterium]